MKEAKMSNCEEHIIYCPNIKHKLINNGFVSPAVLYSKRRHEGKMCEHVLDYSKCNAEEWSAQLEDLLEAGVTDFAVRNEEGSFGARRDFTEQEKAMLPLYPLSFPDDDHVVWYSKWVHEEDPLVYISFALPDEILHFTAFFEDKFDGMWYVKGGKYFCDAPTIVVRNDDYEQAANDAKQQLKSTTPSLESKIPFLEARMKHCSTPAEYARVLLDFVALGDEERKE
jgi:hypothetical protein